MPTTSWQFWGFLAFLCYQAVMATLSYLQNRKSLTKQDQSLENQAGPAKQLNGATAHLEAQSHKLGVAEGMATEKQKGVDDRLREIRGNGP